MRWVYGKMFVMDGPSQQSSCLICMSISSLHRQTWPLALHLPFLVYNTEAQVPLSLTTMSSENGKHYQLVREREVHQRLQPMAVVHDNTFRASTTQVAADTKFPMLAKCIRQIDVCIITLNVLQHYAMCIYVCLHWRIIIMQMSSLFRQIPFVKRNNG